MTDTFFITGISTEVGKTVVAAIVTQSMGADYWKPVQAGELEHTDTDKVRGWVSSGKSKFHASGVELMAPMSPHAAAAIEGVELKLSKIGRPKTKNTLVIEGAGGLLVPLNSKEMVIDLIDPSDKVIIVSKHYLGSINHTLLTIEALRKRKLNIFGIIFNGTTHPSTEAIIAEFGQVPVLGRVNKEPYIDRQVVSDYAEQLKPTLSETQA